MLAHLSTRARRRPILERLGLRRDLSERLILRGVPHDGDLIDETAGWVAAEEAAGAAWSVLDAAAKREDGDAGGDAHGERRVRIVDQRHAESVHDEAE
jgi:hypothetical protein